MRTISEVIEDYKDCQRCEGKSCLGMVSNCSKPDSIVQVESELLRTLIAEISLDRLEEICTAEKDGRCVVLPCKVGDTVWAYSEFGNQVVPYTVELIVISDLTIQFDCNWYSYSECMEDTEFELSDFGKIVFPTSEEAEAKQCY